MGVMHRDWESKNVIDAYAEAQAEIERLTRELQQTSLRLASAEVEIPALTQEVEAWRRSFPTCHVRPGAMYVSAIVAGPEMDATKTAGGE
jgi:chromosome segregation ATPase